MKNSTSSLYYSRTETEQTIVIVWKPFSFYSTVALSVAVLAGAFCSMPAVSLAALLLLFVNAAAYSVTCKNPRREINEATRNSSVQVTGSKYSVSSPLTITIPKGKQVNETVPEDSSPPNNAPFELHKPKTIFEDEFMDLQSGLIALCLEVLEGKQADKIFAYGSNEKKSKSFNAFFEVNGEIKTLSKMGIRNDLVSQFLKLGTHDLMRLDEIGAKYNMRVPTELKLYYDVSSGQFNAEYRYEEICSSRTGKAAGEVFLEWVAEMSK